MKQIEKRERKRRTEMKEMVAKSMAESRNAKGGIKNMAHVGYKR